MGRYYLPSKPGQICIYIASLITFLQLSTTIFYTGLSGWNIALYIDSKLAPVLRLRRNVTYTFIVEAGNNATDPPNYHPFYITNSVDGGIMMNSAQQRAVSQLCDQLS